MLLIQKLFLKSEMKYLFYCYLRALFICFNEYVMLQVVMSMNFAEDGPQGVIVNFGAVMIICELDDLIMKAGRVQAIRERFDNMNDES